MIEAMFVGRPVAGVDAFGVGELVDDGVSGWLCPPRDLGALTDVLSKALITGDTALEAMGRVARDRVAHSHDSAGYVEHFRARLTSWLDRSDGSHR